MSGGVDSSVAAYLLREAGYDVIGLFMRHGEHAETACRVETSASTSDDARAPVGLPIVEPKRAKHKQGCCSASDADDARRVADKLDIPFYAIDFQAEFGRIMDYFVAEYTQARTPNPCVMCNIWLKFGKLWEFAESVGAEHIATGHYARMEMIDGQPALCRGRDLSKDQSYVLFGIEPAMLPRILFPVGDYEKPAIREIATGLGMRVADKKDSQEICFVPDGDYAAFVRRRAGSEDRQGEIVTTSGEVVGQHAGIEGFTIGQRKGLGVAFGEPRYVVRIEPETRRVVVGVRDELARTELVAGRANWLIPPPVAPLECEVKIRYLSERVPATVEPLDGQRLRVVMHQPKHGVAPGQAVVCYDEERVLGGGWIE